MDPSEKALFRNWRRDNSMSFLFVLTLIVCHPCDMPPFVSQCDLFDYLYP